MPTVTFPLSVSYAETPVRQAELAGWGKDTYKRIASELVDQALLGRKPLNFTDIADYELCTWSLLFAEEYCPNPDQVLTTYWSARRGVSSEYPPLTLRKVQRTMPK